MYLPQAVSFPLAIGIEWDLFRRTQLVQEVEMEPAEISFCVVVPLFPADTLRNFGASPPCCFAQLGTICTSALRRDQTFPRCWS